MTAQVVRRQPLANRDRRLIIRIVAPHPGRPEYRHGRANLRERFKRIHEFRHDAEHAPRILFNKAC